MAAGKSLLGRRNGNLTEEIPLDRENSPKAPKGMPLQAERYCRGISLQGPSVLPPKEFPTRVVKNDSLLIATHLLMNLPVVLLAKELSG